MRPTYRQGIACRPPYLCIYLSSRRSSFITAVYLPVDRDTFTVPIGHVDLDGRTGPHRAGRCHAAAVRAPPMTDGARNGPLSRCEAIPRRAMQSRLNGEISNCATCNWHVRSSKIRCIVALRRCKDDIQQAITNCPHSSLSFEQNVV